MEFALDNAIIKMPNGTLLKQVQGIPMGDPITATIKACVSRGRNGQRIVNRLLRPCLRHSPCSMI